MPTYGAELDFAESTKQRALERDNYTCQCCGRKLERNRMIGSGEPYHVHHRTPKLKGGTNQLNNAVCLCTACHKYVEGFQKRGATYPLAVELTKKARRYRWTLDETIEKYNNSNR